ncbi:RNA polymerase sigma factor [Polyangium sp. y55x31]|uniref:RNA polymerase sigma factor n=1 Tax=Polyangium sp. y55x31 TaxID=3042688 RepID=UPI0024824E88|nr:RNA polymerase sigma factor [Polyangium sp. y55x31]MDI1477957.1 RNA polymerase sigma factor [Polyangium sp. y55x31]
MSVDLRLVAARVAGGDVAAFRPIVDHTRVPLYRLAARLVGNLADAEDALQDAYASAFRALSDGRYDGRAKIETWLYRIVTNACVDLLRKRRERPAEDTREPRFDGLVRAEARVALNELDAMLKALQPQDRAALVLVTVEGLSAKEAAEALGCSEGALEQRLVRARAALRTKTEAGEVSDGHA